MGKGSHTGVGGKHGLKVSDAARLQCSGKRGGQCGKFCQLSFDEWSVKAIDKFAGADRDKSGSLDATEFATTRIVRKAAAHCACPPAKEDTD